MQTYRLKLESPVHTSFRCQKAANSLDIDVAKKSVHEIEVEADVTSDFSIGLIVGASGSGKTTLAQHIFKDISLKTLLKDELPVIDQFPESYSYDDCAAALSGIGLTSVPCWIRPVYTLSNGQKARAEAAISMAVNKDMTVIDEWTSVVDRTVAKVMSHCVAKHARKSKKKVVLLSCHYDVVEWLDPDWIIDCNSQKFIDRRSLSCDERRRTEQLTFSIAEVDRSTWKNFSKYHYLSNRLPGGIIKTFGLFYGQDQIGFQCFANYMPHVDKKKPMTMHSNRTVIHPDYAGLGLGIHLINETSLYMKKEKFHVMAKFSSTPIYKHFLKYPQFWKLKEVRTQIGKMQKGVNMKRQEGFRENIKTFSFEFIAK